MEKSKPGIKLGGIGLFLFVFATLIGLCIHSWIFAIPAIFGLGLMIFALFTGETKFIG